MVRSEGRAAFRACVAGNLHPSPHSGLRFAALQVLTLTTLTLSLCTIADSPAFLEHGLTAEGLEGTCDAVRLVLSRFRFLFSRLR